jgi:hypothetical protein
MSQRYIVGSGYIGGDAGRGLFSLIWASNLERNPDCNACQVIIICSRNEFPPLHQEWIKLIRLEGDLGHICRDNSHKHQIEGWPMAVMTGAMLAYNDESDFIFIEQDCLPFGNFVSRMYEEIGEAGLIMGSLSHQPCAQSLFLVRHWFIPQFVHSYLGKKINERKLQGEQVFTQMEQEMPGKIKRFSFGFDRDRPPDGFESMKGKTWYVQQVSVDEVARLKDCGFII